MELYSFYGYGQFDMLCISWKPYLSSFIFYIANSSGFHNVVMSFNDIRWSIIDHAHRVLISTETWFLLKSLDLYGIFRAFRSIIKSLYRPNISYYLSIIFLSIDTMQWPILLFIPHNAQNIRLRYIVNEGCFWIVTCYRRLLHVRLLLLLNINVVNYTFYKFYCLFKVWKNVHKIRLSRSLCLDDDYYSFLDVRHRQTIYILGKASMLTVMIPLSGWGGPNIWSGVRVIGSYHANWQKPARSITN